MSPRGLLLIACAPGLASSVLVQKRAQAGIPAEGSEGSAASFLQQRVGQQGAAAEPFWPVKGGNLNHSGFARFTAPFDLSRPSWTFEEPRRNEKMIGSSMKVFHSSPVIDADYNVYIQSTTGFLYSLDKKGQLRWEFKTSATNPGNLALDGSSVYAIAQDGTAVAVDTATGRERWRNKVAQNAPDDTHSVTVAGDTLLTACNFHNSTQLSDAVCALRTDDGRLKWIFGMRETSRRGDAMACNQMQSVVQGNVLFSDDFGALFAVSLADGKEVWHTQNVTSMKRIGDTRGMYPYGTTATAVVGPSGLIYTPFNTEANKGRFRAHRVSDGGLMWERSFDTELNVAPAVGTLPSGRSVVVLPYGANPSPIAMNAIEAALYNANLIKPVVSKVVAMDALTGETLWSFTLPKWDGRCAGSRYSATDPSGDLCAPDNFGTPTVGADGTVYLNWSGGYAYAVRDENGDGIIDISDPKEVSSYHHGYGSNGATALAPGFAVAPSCRQLIAWAA